MILSILIPSTFDRHEITHDLIDDLLRQAEEEGEKDNIEILTAFDNREESTGSKRDYLIRKAKGKYVCFVDSDDYVTTDYIKLILSEIKKGVDVVGFKGWITTNNKNRTSWIISKDMPYDTVTNIRGDAILYRRFNNHLSPIKREIALQIGYRDMYVGEDYDYAVRLKASGLIKTEGFINKEIYHYKYITKK